MKLGVEPKGVDLIVEPSKRTKQEIELVEKAIAHFKATGEITRASLPKLKPSKFSEKQNKTV